MLRVSASLNFALVLLPLSLLAVRSPLPHNNTEDVGKLLHPPDAKRVSYWRFLTTCLPPFSISLIQSVFEKSCRTRSLCCLEFFSIYSADLGISLKSFIWPSNSCLSSTKRMPIFLIFFHFHIVLPHFINTSLIQFCCLHLRASA